VALQRRSSNRLQQSHVLVLPRSPLDDTREPDRPDALPRTPSLSQPCLACQAKRRDRCPADGWPSQRSCLGIWRPSWQTASDQYVPTGGVTIRQLECRIQSDVLSTNGWSIPTITLQSTVTACPIPTLPLWPRLPSIHHRCEFDFSPLTRTKPRDFGPGVQYNTPGVAVDRATPRKVSTRKSSAIVGGNYQLDNNWKPQRALGAAIIRQRTAPQPDAVSQIISHQPFTRPTDRRIALDRRDVTTIGCFAWRPIIVGCRSHLPVTFKTTALYSVQELTTQEI